MKLFYFVVIIHIYIVYGCISLYKDGCNYNDDCCWSPRGSFCVSHVCVEGTCLPYGHSCVLDYECCSHMCMISETSPGFCQ